MNQPISVISFHLRDFLCQFQFWGFRYATSVLKIQFSTLEMGTNIIKVTNRRQVKIVIRLNDEDSIELSPGGYHTQVRQKLGAVVTINARDKKNYDLKKRAVSCEFRVSDGGDDHAEIMDDGIIFNGSYRGSRCDPKSNTREQMIAETRKNFPHYQHPKSDSDD